MTALVVNGEPREVPEAATVATLLEHLAVRTPRVAVEINGHVVKRDDYPRRALAEGDRVEIVAFVGGGSGAA